jgi:hypothetical protein
MYRIDSAQRLVRTQLWGVVTPAELADAYRDLASKAPFALRYRELCDLLDLDEVSGEDDALAAAAAHSAFRPGVQRAIVAGRSGQLAIAHVLEHAAEPLGQDVRVFLDLADAARWFGIPPDTA